MKILDKLGIIPKNAKDINWELFTTDIVSKYFDKSQPLVFVEIGSLHGKDSMFFKKIYPNAKVYAIEGLEDNYNLFMKHLKDIQTFNICIASHNGKIKYHKKTNLLSGIHSIYNRGDIYGKQTIEVDCQTFETFCVNNHIDKIDVLKIDVEGATYDILNSIQGNLLNKIKLLHIETENYPFFAGQRLDKDCEKILFNHNYECLCKTGYYPESKGMQFDSVWIRKD